MHIHRLDGCAPAPLAHYLKALGVLRLVAEQADENARGWWEGERFWLATSLDRQALKAFFLTAYRPTPFVAPWNAGSGFYQLKDPGLEPIESSRSATLESFRQGIAGTRAILAERAEADARVRLIKDEAKKRGKSEREALRRSADYKKRLAEAERRSKALKGGLIRSARARWRGAHREWMDVAIVLDDSGEPRFPALLGTGGNDGRLDFTNNFMQRLGDLFDLRSPDADPSSNAAGWLAAALEGSPIAGLLQDRAVGQFLPGTAGGANNVNGPEGTSLLNPFDFVLMMEGSMLFRAHAVRRFDVHGAQQRAAAPFVVGAQAAGYASAGESDESARGEQWMPLWNQPATLPEIRRLFAEGRAQIGRAMAVQPLDIARAAARLGVSRGITAFQRYGYIERNGQSNLAVPLGRFCVRESCAPHLDCLEDIGPWLSTLRRVAVGDGGTAQLRQVVRRLGDCSFDVAQHPDESSRWRDLLILLAEIESILKTGSGFQAQPIPSLRPEWVQAADDGSAELRLAVSLALQARAFERDDGRPIDSVRRHWLPLDDKRRRPRFASTGDPQRQRLADRPEVVMQGRSGIDDAIALVERRIVETTQDGIRTVPLRPGRRASACVTDLSMWLEGRVDADRTLALARALMALDGRLWASRIIPMTPPSAPQSWPDDAWLCIRLALSPWKLPDGRQVPCDPAILRRLAGGDAGTAVELALRRLRAVGLRASVRAGTAEPQVARLWAAALAFPVSAATAAVIARRLDSSFAQEQTA